MSSSSKSKSILEKKNQFETFQDQLRYGRGKAFAFRNLQLVAGSVLSKKLDLEHRFAILQACVSPYHMDHSQKEKMKEELRCMVENKHDHPLIRAHASDMMAEIAANVECSIADAIKCEYRAIRICDEATKQDRKIAVRQLNIDINALVSEVPKHCVPLEDLQWTRKQSGRVMDELCKSARKSIKCMRDPLQFLGQRAEEAGNTPGWKEASKQMKSYTNNYENGHTQAYNQAVPSLTGPIIKQVKELPEDDATLLLVFDDALYLGQPPSPPTKNKRMIRAFSIDEERFSSGKTRKVFKHQAISFCMPKDSRQKLLVGIFIKHCLDEYVMPGIRKTHYGVRPRKVLLPPQDANDPQLRAFFDMMGCTLVEATKPKMTDLLFSTLMEVLLDSDHFRMDNAPHLNDVMRGIQCGNCREVGPSLKVCPCERVHYCSKTCQEAQWKSHKRLHSACMKRLLKRQSNGGVCCASTQDVKSIGGLKSTDQRTITKHGITQ
eukprot:CAMPEP_0194030506 /NCGR_PEP_ID=MMETSP0009_2-20130614/3958_1 /TAXON_ID=210454 /ORGANISM="Grammatophora oceanica, Strain CCMP 410" /LENGTH=491 /DNA_ID=CAMNT_0038670461 /DNA_START=181 /DNA_END=1656 /DNA_ORIENTATION=+